MIPSITPLFAPNPGSPTPVGVGDPVGVNGISSTSTQTSTGVFQSVTNFAAGFTWGRVAAFLVGLFLLVIGVWSFFESDTQKQITQIFDGVKNGGALE